MEDTKMKSEKVGKKKDEYAVINSILKHWQKKVTEVSKDKASTSKPYRLCFYPWIYAKECDEIKFMNLENDSKIWNFQEYCKNPKDSISSTASFFAGDVHDLFPPSGSTFRVISNEWDSFRILAEHGVQFQISQVGDSKSELKILKNIKRGIRIFEENSRLTILSTKDESIGKEIKLRVNSNMKKLKEKSDEKAQKKRKISETKIIELFNNKKKKEYLYDAIVDAEMQFDLLRDDGTFEDSDYEGSSSEEGSE